MLPLRRRAAIERESADRFTAGGLYVGTDDRGFSHFGRVTHVSGEPMDIGVGDRVIYSSRIDTFRVGNPPRAIDVVEEASVIGLL